MSSTLFPTDGLGKMPKPEKRPQDFDWIKETCELDAACYLIQKVWEDYKANLPKTPLDAAIGAATGFDVDQTRKTARTTITLIQGLIRNKKRLGLDVSDDKQNIKNLREVLDGLPPPKTLKA